MRAGDCLEDVSMVFMERVRVGNGWEDRKHRLDGLAAANGEGRRVPLSCSPTLRP